MALGNLITVHIPDVDYDLDEFTTLRLYRAASQTASGSLIQSITLVAGQTVYTYQDTSGALSSWYYHNLYDGSSDTTADSERFPATSAPAWTFATLAQQTAERLGLYGLPIRNRTFPGESGTTTGAGSTTTTVCSTYIGTWPTNSWVHWFLRATSGTESGNERLITSFAGASGTFTHDAFASGVGNGATFELYALRPGSWFRERVNEAFQDVWTPVRIPIDGITSQTEYMLPWYIEDPEQILGRTYRTGTGDNLRQQRYYGGQDLVIKPLEGGGCFLYLDSGQAANSVYFLEGYRHPTKLSADTDTLVLAEQGHRLLITTAAMRAAQRLYQEGIGGSTENRGLWQQKFRELEAERKAYVRETGDWKRQRSPRQTSMVTASGERPLRRDSAYY